MYVYSTLLYSVYFVEVKEIECMEIVFFLSNKDLRETEDSFRFNSFEQVGAAIDVGLEEHKDKITYTPKTLHKFEVVNVMDTLDIGLCTFGLFCCVNCFELS